MRDLPVDGREPILGHRKGVEGVPVRVDLDGGMGQGRVCSMPATAVAFEVLWMVCLMACQKSMWILSRLGSCGYEVAPELASAPMV